MFKYFSRRIVIHDTALVHYNDAVHIFRHIFHAVGYQQDGKSSLCLQFFDLLQDLISSLGIQSGCRLVQDQYLRLHGQHAGYRHTTLLSTGQFKGGLIEKFIRQSYFFQSIVCTKLHFLFIQSQILRSETDIAEYIDLKQLMLRILEHQPYLAAELLHIIIFVVDIFSVKIDMSVGSTDQSVHMLHQRRLTGTGMPNDTDELSIRYLQADIVQGMNCQRCICTVYIIHMI